MFSDTTNNIFTISDIINENSPICKSDAMASTISLTITPIIVILIVVLALFIACRKLISIASI